MEKNSMLYWYPKIKDLDIPQPKTEIIKMPDFWKFMDEYKKFKKYFPEIKQKAKKIGYPLFVRTDFGSGKHLWNRLAFMENEKQLFNCLASLVDDNLCKDMLCQALVLREYIEMDSKFRAFDGLPISSERRYFVKEGHALCHHSYWIEDAIRFWKGTKEPDNWRELLKEVNTESKEEIGFLKKHAETVAKEFEGYWSVDFCRSKDGTWYLIDMAMGNVSWHPDCIFKSMANLEEIHNCEKCRGKVVLIEVDMFGNTSCGYCHEKVNYFRGMNLDAGRFD